METETDTTPARYDEIQIDLLIPMYLASIRQLTARINEISTLLQDIPFEAQDIRKKMCDRAYALMETRFLLIDSVMDLKPIIEESSMFTDEVKELFGLSFYFNLKGK